MALPQTTNALDLVAGIGSFKDQPYSQYKDIRPYFGIIELRQDFQFDTKTKFEVIIGHKSLLEAKDPNAGLNYLEVNAVFELF